MKQSGLLLVMAMFCFLVILGCEEKASTTAETAAAFDLEAASAKLNQNATGFMEAFKSGDSATLASFYSSDGWVMAPGGEPVPKDQIAAMWGSVARMGIREIKLEITDVTGSAAHLIETGKFELFDSSNQSVDKGKYVVVWKPENGEWKMFRDIWNSNLPPASR